MKGHYSAMALFDGLKFAPNERHEDANAGAWRRNRVVRRPRPELALQGSWSASLLTREVWTMPNVRNASGRFLFVCLHLTDFPSGIFSTVGTDRDAIAF